MRHNFKVGDLVEPRSSWARRIIWEAGFGERAVPEHGLVTALMGGEILRVYWADGRPRPINSRLLRKL